MTNKLEDFRLRDYNERSILLTALSLYRHRYPDMYAESVNDLALRLSHTQCQLGGCSHCGGPQDDFD